MTVPVIDWEALTDDEINQIVVDGHEEQTRRAMLVSIPEQITGLNEQYLDASGVVEGEAWVQPTGAHDAYLLDWVVTHNGGSWKSLVASNVWEPGVSGWAVEGGGEWPMWVQPTGAHDAYSAGAKVSHIDLHWTSDVSANVWEPGVYGWTEA